MVLEGFKKELEISIESIIPYLTGEYIVKNKPCEFLTKDGCSIYDSRPKACREYPYTDNKDFVSRLFNMVSNCEVCPVVFEIFKKLKAIYRNDFDQYSKKI